MEFLISPLTLTLSLMEREWSKAERVGHECGVLSEGAALPIPEELLIFARQLRKEQTDAELLLWHLLRGRRFCGYKFRRQYPVCGYILDFYCHDAGLAIELDGGGHNHEEQRLYDEERTKILEAVSIRVLRFWNNDVLNSVEDVLEEIYSHLRHIPSP